MEAVIEFCVKTTFLHVTSTILSFIFVVTSNCAAENQVSKNKLSENPLGYLHCTFFHRFFAVEALV